MPRTDGDRDREIFDCNNNNKIGENTGELNQKSISYERTDGTLLIPVGKLGLCCSKQQQGTVVRKTDSEEQRSQTLTNNNTTLQHREEAKLENKTPR